MTPGNPLVRGSASSTGAANPWDRTLVVEQCTMITRNLGCFLLSDILEVRMKAASTGLSGMMTKCSDLQS